MCSHVAMAQNDSCVYVLKGIVIDSTEHTPLELTLVSNEGKQGKESRTDKKGHFEISGLCPGSIGLHISHLNCEHIHLQIDIRRDTFITIYLKHTVQELEGYKLTQTHSKQAGMSVSSGKQLESRRVLSLGSMMQEIPGISLIKTGNSVSKPLVNGLYGNRVIIANNGIRQEGQNWGMEHAPEIDAFLASEIELLKGAEALRYGADGIGGVILIKPRNLFAEKKGIIGGNLHIGGNSNGRGSALSAVTGTAFDTKLPLYVRIQGTSRAGGNTRTSQDFLSNTGLSENNFSLNAGIKHAHVQTELFFSSFRYTQGIYTGSQTGNLSDLQTAMNSSRPLIQSGFTYAINRPYQFVSHKLLKSRTEVPLNTKNKIELNLSVQNNNRREYDMQRSSSSFSGPNFDYYIQTFISEALWSRSDFHGLNYKIGLVYLNQSNAYTGRYFIPGFYQNSLAQYLIGSGKFNSKIGYEASLRTDYKVYDMFIWKNKVLNKQHDAYTGVTYAAGIHRYGKRSRFSFLHTSAWRPPSPNELFADGLHQGLASIEKGDSGLSPERSFNFSINHSFTRGAVSAEYEVFYQNISNFINLIPSTITQLSIRGAYPVFVYTQSNALLYGLNFKLKADLGKNLFITVQGNAVNGTDADRNTPVAMIPPYTLRMNVGYELKKFSVAAWTLYTARQFRYREGSDFMTPPPAYVLAGLDAHYQLIIRRQEIRCQISVSNLGNSSYRDYMNRFRYFTDEQGFNLFAKITIPLQFNLKPKQQPTK